MNRTNAFPTPARQSPDLADYALGGSFRVGEITVHHLSDGLAFGPRRNWFTGIDPSVWMPVLDLEDPDTPFPLNYGLFVVVGHGVVTLVDSGFGPEAQRLGGARGGNELRTRLHEIGIGADDVDHVVQTHLHADHCGQLVTDTAQGARPTFGRATVHVHARELEHWTGATTDDNFMAPYVRSRIGPVRDAGRVSTFTALTRIAPGVVALPVPGHTPGHTCVLVSDRDRHCLLVGDLAHHPVHFRHHDWLHAFDHDPAASVAARAALCELAVGLDAVVTAPHMPVLTLGRIGRDPGGGYSWTPVDAGGTGGPV
ncbi:MBL fold metallo-hydrolase [Pseudonocardia nematodicida]|uniref:MBL fold metallo-hydrolase n=1 Tax=Pseudonocardia nematodicida TaxID=1206997 RepID=A0ABV1KE25_9PSEU